MRLNGIVNIIVISNSNLSHKSVGFVTFIWRATVPLLARTSDVHAPLPRAVFHAIGAASLEEGGREGEGDTVDDTCKTALHHRQHHLGLYKLETTLFPSWGRGSALSGQSLPPNCRVADVAVHARC